MKIGNLQHETIDLPNGGFVLSLNPGSRLLPEEVAMMQALYSRSVGSITDHLEQVARTGAARFMEEYYVGYNHKSIGDCGSTTIFIEGVSMLAAKAIQDWALYSGQESSTRYIDFATQPFIDPVDTHESALILEAWREFYTENLPLLIVAFTERYPREKGESKTKYKKAIKARAFDVLRGFLPAGAETNLSWHSNLRQIADKLRYLRHHPLLEVHQIAHSLEKLMLKVYPSSFTDKRYPDTESYIGNWMTEQKYHVDPDCSEFALVRDGISRHFLEKYHEVLADRPPKTELPHELDECGTVSFEYLLDFGSYRDAQRHRAIVQRTPLLTTTHGFNEWYLSELPSEMRVRTEAVLAAQYERIDKLRATTEEKQYYIPMGTNVANRATGGLSKLVYIIELRATRFVHPTLRRVARQMGERLLEKFGHYGLAIHFDEDPDRFDIGRGAQDIVKVKTKK